MSIEKTPPSRHILISCALEDAPSMETLLAGMRVHSDFNVIRTTEIMRWTDAENPLPVAPFWVGFAHPGFAWDTLAGLLSSVTWRYEDQIVLHVEHDQGDGAVITDHGIENFVWMVREGAFK